MLLADRLQQALAQARRTRGSLAPLVLDLNRFKEVNDTPRPPGGRCPVAGGRRPTVADPPARSTPVARVEALVRWPHPRLHALRRMGVQIAIDDFGAGQTSLAYLKHLPVTQLKIDRSFVRDLLTSGHDAKIVRSAIELAHQLGLGVVAEGVEDAEPWERLTALGCDIAQGYYYSRPLPEDQVLAWFRTAAQTARISPPKWAA